VRLNEQVEQLGQDGKEEQKKGLLEQKELLEKEYPQGFLQHLLE
jgi:hypothetical protein